MKVAPFYFDIFLYRIRRNKTKCKTNRSLFVLHFVTVNTVFLCRSVNYKLSIHFFPLGVSVYIQKTIPGMANIIIPIIPDILFYFKRLFPILA